jgi:outer membrane protein insertion porin family
MRPSAYVDVGSLFKLTHPALVDDYGYCYKPGTTTTDPQIVDIPQDNPTFDCATAGTGFSRINGTKQTFLGDSAKPRLSVGVGVNWISPFGPLRIDIAKALLKQEGDDTKLFSFNVGTQF